YAGLQRGTGLRNESGLAWVGPSARESHPPGPASRPPPTSTACAWTATAARPPARSAPSSPTGSCARAPRAARCRSTTRPRTPPMRRPNGRRLSRSAGEARQLADRVEVGAEGGLAFVGHPGLGQGPAAGVALEDVDIAGLLQLTQVNRQRALGDLQLGLQDV